MQAYYNSNNHHYAIDAAKLVERCRSLLHSILKYLECHSSTRVFRRRAVQLVSLCDVLKCVDRLIHTHLLDLLSREMEYLSSIHDNDTHKKAQLHQFFGEHTEFPTLMNTVKTLRCAAKVARECRWATNAGCMKAKNGIGIDMGQQQSLHRRIHSTLPAILPGGGSTHFLSIDDPIEDDSYAQGWYSGRRSPSPPPPLNQSAGDTTSSPSQAHHRRAMSDTRPMMGHSTFPILSTPSPSSGREHSPLRSTKDSSLFRLIVTLQLCLVRLEEANSILCDGKADSGRGCEYPRSSSPLVSGRIVAVGVTIGSAFVLSSRLRAHHVQLDLLPLAGKASAGMATASLIRRQWRILCMNARVANSAAATEEWILQWICLVNNNGTGMDAGYKNFISPRKPLLWYSNGSIRFQLIKRGMDLLYASIGKAIEITRGHEIVEPSITTSKSSSLWTYVVASLTASYYNVIGPAAKSASSLANAPSSIIQNAWGMVSLPAVKKASLEATRILKGAAIADRIEICGVSCFVLSRESFPALASALRRFHRQQEREDSKLGTIYETMSNHPSTVNINKGFQKRDIILHLTGGGFFAHTIAGDLPYLLDWSATTNAVIIVPEYSLFPHKYPDAINEVTQIYRALRFGQAATLLGFQSDRIVVSGESVGGNLATALCVSLVMDHKEGESYDLPHRGTVEFNDLEDALGFSVCERSNSGENSREICNSDVPDALLLCCPALNLALDLTPSRVDGANDPVLPSALISTISASYLGGCSSTDPIASPYFASDATICNFPPTLIFTSSEDPLLDDSVTFNSRLRSVGVKSSLRAVHDLPHAFWGLSTAGIPEARQVQKECQQFLARVFCSDAQ